MAATHPTYRTTATDVGADINYDCPCGCDAGFAFDRSAASQAPESCCCGRNILVGVEASTRLRAALIDPANYAFDAQRLAMPWGQTLEVALATPPDAEHEREARPGQADPTAHDHPDHAQGR